MAVVAKQMEPGQPSIGDARSASRRRLRHGLDNTTLFKFSLSRVG